MYHNYFGFSHGNCKPQNRRKIIVCNSYNSHGKTKIIVILTIPMGNYMIIVMFTISMEKTKIIMILSISMDHNHSVSQFVKVLMYVSIFRTRMSQKTLVKRKFWLLVFSMGIVNSTMIMGFPMGIIRIAMILVFLWELLVTNRDGTYKSLEPKF